MTATQPIEQARAALERAHEDAQLAGARHAASSAARELTYEVAAPAARGRARTLRDAPELSFEMLMDVGGVDYLQLRPRRMADRARHDDRLQPRRVRRTASTRDAARSGARFAVVYHLLSVSHNQRLRLRVPCEGRAEPVVDSLVAVWAAANWFEREAFDLFGILFRGHPDLRRILTDYGFVGHPFRKDFPLIGQRRSALRPGEEARRLPAREHRAARAGAARSSATTSATTRRSETEAPR